MTIDASPPSRRPAYLRVARLSLLILLSLYLFLLSLELIKGGARSLLDWFPQNAVHTSRGALGMGWLFSCIVLSGSPVAATALAFLDSEILDPMRSFSMVIGSRLGASFVVLVVGLAYDLQARRDKGGVYVGALALITTATVYVPAFFLGYALLDGGWLEGLRFGIPGWLKSPLDWALDRAVCELQGTLPEWGEALLGVALLVTSFKLFDGFLPVVDPTGGRLSKMATTVYRPWITFAFGMLVTCITLSVSVSLTLLVPLTVRGIVRRENLIPYILGANITTFVDTLFASLLLENPAGFTVVLCAVSAVTALSMPVVFVAYRPYESLVDGLARTVSRGRLRLVGFLLVLFATALGLIFFQ